MHLSLLSVAAATAATIAAATAATIAAAGALLFSGRSTVGTTARFVHETFAGEELLLARAKVEIRAAVRARQSFVYVLHG
jgi:hypothetical protein